MWIHKKKKRTKSKLHRSTHTLHSSHYLPAPLCFRFLLYNSNRFSAFVFHPFPPSHTTIPFRPPTEQPPQPHVHTYLMPTNRTTIKKIKKVKALFILLFSTNSPCPTLWPSYRTTHQSRGNILACPPAVPRHATQRKLRNGNTRSHGNACPPAGLGVIAAHVIRFPNGWTPSDLSADSLCSRRVRGIQGKKQFIYHSDYSSSPSSNAFLYSWATTSGKGKRANFCFYCVYNENTRLTGSAAGKLWLVELGVH